MEILACPHTGIPVPEHQPPPSVKFPASPQPIAAGSKPPLLYKCLLNEHAQKLRKSLPVFNTKNEGSAHMPKFRSTVLFDGLRFTSTNTFQQRKMAEMDVSRIAYITLTQKFKSDALQFIREDKTFCKSILMEIAAKMNLGRPEYETSNLGTLVPSFRSSLFFNGVAYLGDDGKTKKESEQLAARAVILKYLDSESGLDVAEIVNCKFRQFVEMNKIQKMSNGHFLNLVEPKAKLGISTMQNFSPGVTQSRVQEASLNKIQEMSNGHNGLDVALIVPKSELEMSTMLDLSLGVTQSRGQEASIETSTQVVPVVTQPPMPEISIAPTTPAVSIVNQPPIPEVFFKKIMPAVPAPVILTQTASAEINNSATPFVVSTPSLGTLSSIPATPLASNVIQPANSVASLSLPSESLKYVPLTGQTSGKKRRRKNKKNAQKRMCLGCLHAQKAIPVLPATQVQPFPSQ